ncbi:MAG TPA: aminotransferase class I/II-fold pyridoxal phosphate-dependent enzyme [Kofleriaceae bacterium]|nr:aminotransferase class I/II-fold pyridoxal phosphate-dependent enzyme [Kofleriaceae bacterium]
MAPAHRPETLAAQAMHTIDEPTGGVVPAIQLATTYVRDAAYESRGRLYTRADNPTPEAAERVIAALEGGAEALTFASGMAAAAAAIRAHLRPGDHVISPRVAYYNLRAWLTKFCARWGVHHEVVDTSDLDAVRRALRPTTKLVWLETPSNPLWEVTDIAAITELAHAAGARVVVDSTCATPVHSQPLALGADLVMHAATKYLAGHSDVLAGALVTRQRDEMWAEITELRHDEGPMLAPFEAYLLLRGLRTLFARVERASKTALYLAEQLAARGVHVRYPGLASHPQHALARRQMTRGFGGMLSIHAGGDAAGALAIVRKLALWLPATSLGGVESLVEHRSTAEGPDSPCPPDLLRLSVGLEHEDDLLADLLGALA